MFNLHQQCLQNQGYEPLELLGQGSYSSVYKVKDLNNNRFKAVKIIENQFTTLSANDDRTNTVNRFKETENSIEELRRKKLRAHKINQKYFCREIITARRLLQSYHPYVVKIFSIKKTLLYTYIYMEHLSKGNLNEYLNKNGPLEPDDNLPKLWIYQLASALEYLHSIGIAHRDIKLQNIGLTDELNAKLIDFGFACKCIINKNSQENNQANISLNNCELSLETRSTDSNLINLNSLNNELFRKQNFELHSSRIDNSSSTHPTTSNQQVIQFSMSQCGTPLYIAPEVIIADKCPYDTRKADIWSLGVTMFAILSYRFPFTRRNFKILYRQQLKRSWMSKRVYNFFSIDAFDLLNCMLEPFPKKRFTATQVVQHDWCNLNKTQKKINNLTDQINKHEEKA